MLKSKGPNIELWGIPQMALAQSLYAGQISDKLINYLHSSWKSPAFLMISGGIKV